VTASQLDVSIVVETYNFGDRQGAEMLPGAIAAAARAAAAHADWEVLLLDTCGAPGLDALLAGAAHPVRRVDAAGLSYDVAKMRAAGAARGRFLVFLDGDCEPLVPDWADHLLAPLRRGEAIATGGLTRYPEGLLQDACSVLDFGFLFDALEQRTLGCYAFNNVAFDRAALLAHPVPEGPMRCLCYAHAQLLERLGQPVRLVPEARVVHAATPFVKERLRRGYDLVAACWANPALRESAWLDAGLLAAPRFYWHNLQLDWKRTGRARRFFGWSAARAAAVAALPPLLRLTDLVGMVRALAGGPEANPVKVAASGSGA
jgi:hypothetical protein